MPRGKIGAIYTTDNAVPISTTVDADYAADASRGWIPMGEGAAGYLAPRGSKFRRVYGLDATGRRGSAIVASTTAPLWTGAATTFSIEGDDLQSHVMVVTGRVGEKFRLAHGPVPTAP